MQLRSAEKSPVGFLSTSEYTVLLLRSFASVNVRRSGSSQGNLDVVEFVLAGYPHWAESWNTATSSISTSLHLSVIFSLRSTQLVVISCGDQ